MTVFKKPKNGESVRNENMVIGHLESSIIVVKNEEGELFFLYGSSDNAEIGTVIENEYLAPISSLPPMEQKRILEMFS